MAIDNNSSFVCCSWLWIDPESSDSNQ